MTDRENAREEINSRPDLVLDQLVRSKSKNQYECPICGSGTRGGSSSDGALTFYPETNRFYCFACDSSGDTFGGKGQDVLGALRILWNCSENEVFERVGVEYGYNVPQNHPTSAQNGLQGVKSVNTPPQANAPQNAAQSVTAVNYSQYYEWCIQNLTKYPQAMAYLSLRGISINTANKHCIGFDPAWRSPTALKNGKNPPASPRLILPTCSTHYVARDVRPEVTGKFVKMNEGSPAIFNTPALYDISNEAVFVVEGIFDALSIIETGAAAIALNSTSNAKRLIEALKAKRTGATLILCFDKDKAGQDCTKEIKEGLNRLNISYVTADICGGSKDPNEALQADRERFTKAITAAQRQTAARPDNVSGYIDDLMTDEIRAFREARSRRTGFANLDEKAKGLYDGLYVVAAISSLGKTTFCHQIADQLAEAGEDVLFFSLEQSRLELVSKSLARRTAQKDITTASNSLQIRQWNFKHDDPANKEKRVLAAAEEYKAAIGDRLSVVEGNFSCDISFIGEYIRRYINKTGKKPVIFLDYLQILQPEQDTRGRQQSTKETVDTTVTELKRISREHGLTVFVISSVNRSNYLTPIDFESLKESGGIEYTADVIWGLQLQCLNNAVFDGKEKIKEKRQTIKDAKAANPRKIELVCLKNRYGVSSYSAYFDYYPEHDLFTEGAAPEEPRKAGKRL